MNRLTLVIKALLLPRVNSPLFHKVRGHYRVNSIEFTMRLMNASRKPAPIDFNASIDGQLI